MRGVVEEFHVYSVGVLARFLRDHIATFVVLLHVNRVWATESLPAVRSHPKRDFNSGARELQGCAAPSVKHGRPRDTIDDFALRAVRVCHWIVYGLVQVREPCTLEWRDERDDLTVTCPFFSQ